MIDSIQNENFLLTMELSKYKENTKNTSSSATKNNFMLDIKKSIFLDEQDLPEVKENLNLENDEFNNLLKTKESKEFANRLRESVLRKSTFEQNLEDNSPDKKRDNNNNS